MTEKKGWGHTVLGWFVVPEDDPEKGELPISSSIVDAADARLGAPELPKPPSYQPPPHKPATPSAKPAAGAPPKPAGPAAQSAAAPPPAPVPPVFHKEPPAATGGAVDFAKVFDAASIGAEEQDRVAKSVALLRSLPADTAPAVKKQIVEASLKAFGVPIDKIIETGVEEIQALEAYIRTGAAATQKSIDDSQKRIETLEQSIKELRAEMQQRVTDQQSILKTCNEKKLEVQQILEFFGQEKVAKVVQESPKLHDPANVK